MDQNDSQQIDLLRFPLMLGVILSHAHSPVGLPGVTVQASPAQPVAMFTELTILGLWAKLATPLFFLFAGYLLYHGESLNLSLWLSKLKGRFPRLGVPYLIWNGAIFLMYYVGQAIPAVAPFFTKPEYEIAKLDLWQRINLLVGITRFPIDYQFWFIRDLLVLIVLSPLIWLAIRYARIPTIALCVALWSGWLGEVPLPVQSRALMFFTLGVTLGQISGKQFRVPHHAAFVVVFVLSVLADAGVRTFLPFEGYETTSDLWTKANVFLGICAAWTVAGWVRRSANLQGLLGYLRRYAFFAFAAHEPLLMTLKKLAYTKLGYATSAQLLTVYLGTACMTILACLGCGILLDYLLPAVFNVLTAQRASRTGQSHRPDGSDRPSRRTTTSLAS